MRYASMFSGGGGLDMAVQLLFPDADLAWWSENDPAAAEVFANHHDAPNLGDVTTIDWTTVEPVDMIAAGFPCQDISHAGNQAGITEGTRSGLWFHIIQAVRVLRPRLLLLENVPAIASVNNGLDVVLGSLAEIGWNAEWGMLRASDVGACHERNRWFCVAWPADADGPRWGERRGAVPVPPQQPAVEHAGQGSRFKLLPTPTVGDARASGNSPDSFNVTLTDATRSDRRSPAWGEYATAIAHHAATFGYGPLPPVNTEGQLSPYFVEWMMGWPIAHTYGPSRSRRLQVLGNGVVPQQAAHAFAQLLARMET